MNDVLVAPVWLAATLLLLWAAWVAAGRFLPQDPFASGLMHSLVLSWACAVGVATLLGSIGWLTPAALLGGVVAVAGAALWWWPTTASAPGGFKGQPKDQAGQTAVAASAGADTRTGFVWIALWGFVFACALSRIVLHGLLRFPDDWDTLNYHLPL